MSFKRALIAQFKQPSGVLGALAGAAMAARPSNRRRNAWTVDLLDVRRGDRVLEIGCGPGYAIGLIAARIGDGTVVGVDHSETMLRQAGRRNARAVARGQVDLRLGGLDALNQFDQPFDAVMSANVVQFWDDPQKAFAEIARVLAPDGRVATTYQPRAGDVSPGAARAMAERIVAWLRAAGFSRAEIHELELPRAPAVCVIGRCG